MSEKRSGTTLCLYSRNRMILCCKCQWSEAFTIPVFPIPCCNLWQSKSKAKQCFYIQHQYISNSFCLNENPVSQAEHVWDQICMCVKIHNHLNLLLTFTNILLHIARFSYNRVGHESLFSFPFNLLHKSEIAIKLKGWTKIQLKLKI